FTLGQRLKSAHNFILLILIGILGLENPFEVFTSQVHYILHPFHCFPPTNGALRQTGNNKHSPKLNRSTKGSKVPLHLTQPSNYRESFWSTIKLSWLETHEPLEVISLIRLTFPRSWRLIVYIAHLDECLLHCLDQMSEIQRRGSASG
ncbi:hypothetical protein PanWU01x14_249360, partial [Parasponia andersonii]